MSNKRISELTAYTTPVSGDVLPINDTANSLTKKVTVNNLFNILSSLFTIKDSTDTTKKVAFDVSGVTTGTTRTITIPDANTTMVGTDTTQTLTNKTLTNPVVNVGSDAEGDTYYRNSSGSFVRLPRGTDNYILKMNGNVPNWEAESVTSNATTTTSGVSELATSSEINSGTATGGSGAPLVMTPDGFASSQYANSVRVLSKSYSNTTVSNTTSETTLFSYTVPGGTLGSTKAIRVRGAFAVSFNATGAGNNLTLRLKLGGTTLDTNTITPTVAMGTTSTDSGIFDITLFATGATNTQEWMYSFLQGNQSAGTVSDIFRARKKGTSSADSTIDRDLVITAQYATASTVNTIVIENYIIELIP